MFHLDDAGQILDALRLARVHVAREDLWQWLKSHLGPLPEDATLHDILYTRHGVTFVLKASTFPEATPSQPLPWLHEVTDG